MKNLEGAYLQELWGELHLSTWLCGLDVFLRWMKKVAAGGIAFYLCDEVWWGGVTLFVRSYQIRISTLFVRSYQMSFSGAVSVNGDTDNRVIEHQLFVNFNTFHFSRHLFMIFETNLAIFSGYITSHIIFITIRIHGFWTWARQYAIDLVLSVWIDMRIANYIPIFNITTWWQQNK